MCVFFPLTILDIKFFRRTSRDHTGGRSHRMFHPPSFCGARLNFSREKDSAISIPRRPLCRILCTNDLINRSPLLGHFFSFFLRKKKRLSGFELASQRVRRLRCYFGDTGATGFVPVSYYCTVLVCHYSWWSINTSTCKQSIYC